jgi:hypothetical protein
LPDLRERYGHADTRPFGAGIAYRMLQNIYPDKFITVNKKSFSRFYKDTHIDSASFYINISNRFFPSEADAQDLLDYVYDGNTAFIASSIIDSSLLTKIFCRQENSMAVPMLVNKKYSYTKLSLLPDAYSLQDSFAYYYLPFTNYFSEIHADRGRITGYNQNGKPNFMVLFWGKGRLFLHCEARAFSNYFLLTQNNHLYFKQIMQMMSSAPGNIFWDDYYNKINFRETKRKSFSSLNAILKHPALAMAFWIGLATLLAYIFFAGKRKQRIVPVIDPVENTSIAFTEAVAGLYLSEKNNKNIAEKMISYFNEYIRSRYFLHMYPVTNDLLLSLSKKSGVEMQQVADLYELVQEIPQAYEVSDSQLLSLNEQIQNFYKN